MFLVLVPARLGTISKPQLRIQEQADKQGELNQQSRPYLFLYIIPPDLDRRA